VTFSGELRCSEGKLFGIMVDGVLEVSCQSKFCRSQLGMTVIHRFDLATGKMLEDRRYRSPVKRGK
jgi:hypothetical protein